MQTKFFQTVMAFGCVSYDGDAMPAYFFQRGSQVGLRCLHGVANHCS